MVLPPKSLIMYFLSMSLFLTLLSLTHLYNCFLLGIRWVYIGHVYTHIKQHVLMMSHKETGSVLLSYRCSHEHHTVTQLSWRISSSLSLSLSSPSFPQQSDKSVSDLVRGPGLSIDKLFVQPFDHSPLSWQRTEEQHVVIHLY